MSEEEFIGKLQLVYVGDKRAIEEIISEYDRLNNVIKAIEENLYLIKDDYTQHLFKIIIERLKENNK